MRINNNLPYLPCDTYERFLAATKVGLYESHYLKANSPNGKYAFWIKHNLLTSLVRPPIAEFWLIWFERYHCPKVFKREVAVEVLTFKKNPFNLRGDHFYFDASTSCGAIADASWNLQMSDSLPPLFHFPFHFMYKAPFPKKKILTPCPNLHFTGTIAMDGKTIPVSNWIGLRGHNWGTEHAHSYAYGNCNLWDDGNLRRTVDAFTARVRIGKILSPWLSSALYHDQDRTIDCNQWHHWLNLSVELRPTHWYLSYKDLKLSMRTEWEDYVGLRYNHPDGRESYCYNTKFAKTEVQLVNASYLSQCGELEMLFPTPHANIKLHPPINWRQTDGDYRG